MIGAVSYLAMQLYEYGHHRLFRAVHTCNAALQVITFAHVPSDLFLCLLPGAPSITPNGLSLSLAEDAFIQYTDLASQTKQIGLAVKALQTARRKGEKAGELNDESEGEYGLAVC